MMGCAVVRNAARDVGTHPPKYGTVGAVAEMGCGRPLILKLEGVFSLCFLALECRSGRFDYTVSQTDALHVRT